MSRDNAKKLLTLFTILLFSLTQVTFALSLEASGNLVTDRGFYTNRVYPDSGNFEVGDTVLLDDSAIPEVDINYEIGVIVEHDVPFDDVVIDYELKVTVTEIVEDPQPVDIVWILDRSLSMADDIQAVQDHANEFLSELENANIPYRLGVVGFMRNSIPILYDGVSSSFGTDEGTFTTDSAEWLDMLEFVQNRLTMHLEAGLTAADQTVDYYNFNPAGKTFFVILSDENSDDYDGPYSSCYGFATPTKLDETVALMMANDITVYTLALPTPVRAPGGCREYSSGPEYYDPDTSVAAQTGGSWFDITRAYPGLLEQMGEHIESNNGGFIDTEYTISMSPVTITTANTVSNPALSSENPIRTAVIAQTGISDLYTNSRYLVNHEIIVTDAQFASGGAAPMIYGFGFHDNGGDYYSGNNPETPNSPVGFFMTQTNSGVVTETHQESYSLTLTPPVATDISSDTIRQRVQANIDAASFPDIYNDPDYTLRTYFIEINDATYPDGSSARPFVDISLELAGAEVSPTNTTIAENANIILNYVPDRTKYSYFKAEDDALTNVRLHLYTQQDGTSTKNTVVQTPAQNINRGTIVFLPDLWNPVGWGTAGFSEDQYTANVELQNAAGSPLGINYDTPFQLYVEQDVFECGITVDEQGLGMPVTGSVSPPQGLTLTFAEMQITRRSTGDITTVPLTSVGGGDQLSGEFVTYDADFYDYIINFENTDGSSTFSGSCSGTVEYYIDVNFVIQTDKDAYTGGEVVLLTDETQVTQTEHCYTQCSLWSRRETCVRQCSNYCIDESGRIQLYR